jgi:hypothetical protein
LGILERSLLRNPGKSRRRMAPCHQFFRIAGSFGP